MPKGFFKKDKNGKVKRFLFFLLLATIFWVLAKFSREFTAIIIAKIDYENIPETAALSEGNPSEITFDLTANGFEILFYKLKNPSIIVPVQKYYDKDKAGFEIPKDQLLRMVSSSFNRNFAIKNLSLEELNVYLDPIVLKKVRVIVKTDIIFKDGFKPVDSIKILPDSVIISGSSGSLKKINTIETELITIKDVEKDISETVKITIPKGEIISINPNKVDVNLAVAEFFQRQFTIQAEVINLPPNVEVKLVPQSITVTFDVSVNDFAKITEESFRLVCDYARRNKDENFMLPFLEKKPDNIHNVVFEPKKVDFFIFK